jgi:hypothetical protein
MIGWRDYWKTVSLIILPALCLAQNGNFVPGSGSILQQVGDDFEDPSWDYIFNGPKSSEEINKNQNLPLGKSTNGRWFEGAKRGHPDVLKRVETPDGGLPGSEGALLMKSLQTGIQGSPSHKMQQEDFILNVQYRTGGSIPIAKSPSVTTRVYFPPTDQWERRSGPHFAFRVALETTKKSEPKFPFFTSKNEEEIYWPGLFVCMDTKESSRQKTDQVYFRVRANGRGGDVRGPDMTEMGWWTLGISVSANGAVHYYAKPGVDELTHQDYIATEFPYNFRAERFRSAFFNVVNGDNGRTWSTTFIIDDTRVYLGTAPSQVAGRSAQTTRVARQTNSTQSAAPVVSRQNMAGKASRDSSQPSEDMDYYR